MLQRHFKLDTSRGTRIPALAWLPPHLPCPSRWHPIHPGAEPTSLRISWIPSHPWSYHQISNRLVLSEFIMNLSMSLPPPPLSKLISYAFPFSSSHSGQVAFLNKPEHIHSPKYPFIDPSAVNWAWASHQGSTRLCVTLPPSHIPVFSLLCLCCFGHNIILGSFR